MTSVFFFIDKLEVFSILIINEYWNFLLVGLGAELLLSFSVITNFRAICDRGVGSDTIPSIHGLRAISMAWVILGRKIEYTFFFSNDINPVFI